MNVLKSKIQRQQELDNAVSNVNPNSAILKEPARNNSPSRKITDSMQIVQKLSKIPARNLDEATSATEIQNSNATAMIHNQPALARSFKNSMQPQISYRKILGGIEKMSVMQSDPQFRVRNQKPFRSTIQNMVTTNTVATYQPVPEMTQDQFNQTIGKEMFKPKKRIPKAEELRQIIRPQEVAQNFQARERVENVGRSVLERNPGQEAIGASRISQGEKIFNQVLIQPRVKEFENKIHEINSLAQEIKLYDGGQRFLQELPLDEVQDEVDYKPDDILDMVMQKFSMKGQNLTCFTEQIRISPPQYLQQPSQHTNNNYSVQDLILKAKAGIQKGDMVKEALINLQLGEQAEKSNSMKLASQCYKRFYLVAKVIQDEPGCCLALNRLGIVYSKRGQYEVSHQYHLRHLEMMQTQDRFIPQYNAGLALRFSKNFKGAESQIKSALQNVQERDVSFGVLQHVQDFESISLCFGQLATIAFQLKDFDTSISFFQKCLQIATQLGASRMKLESLLCLAYMSFDREQWSNAKDFFNQAYFVGNDCNERGIAEKCLCNAGIASANTLGQSQQTMYQTFYKSKKEFNLYQEEDDGNEDEEATY